MKLQQKHFDYLILAIIIVWALASLVVAVAAVYIAVDLHSFVNGNAWDAPWLNVIERGPVQ